MPHMAGVLDDRADDCGIYLNEMMGFYSMTLEEDNGEAFAVISSMWSCHVTSCEITTPNSRVQFTCSICLSFIVIGGMSGGFILEAYVVGCSPLCHFVCRCLKRAVGERI